MAKLPTYRLQTLFELRERAKKDAEDAYAIEQKKVQAEQKKLDDLNADLAERIRQREQKIIEYAQESAQGKSTIEKMQGQGRHIDSLKEKEALLKIDIEKQEDVLKRAQKVAQEKLEIMLKATQEFKALEKHKEKWTKEVKKELEKKEEESAEDISQSQYFSRSKDQDN